jgi:hypothetical protein
MLTEDEGREVLGPHDSRFAEVLERSWERWCEKVRPTLPRHSARCRANVIYVLMENEARRVFVNVPGVRMVNGKRFQLAIDDRLLVGFKLLDQQLRTRNYPTPSARAYDLQRKLDDSYLPGMGHYERVKVGYCLDRTGTEVTGNYVVYAIGKRIVFFWGLERQANGQVIYHPFGSLALPLGGELVKVKETPKPKVDDSEPEE